MADSNPSEAVTDQEVTIKRVFDAPPELVWRAFTDPDQVAKWWGPHGFTTPRDRITIELTEGGAFNFTMIEDATGTEHHAEGSFTEVEEPKRLAFSSEVSGEVELTAVSIVTFSEFEPGKTEVIVRQSMKTTEEIAEGSQEGWSQQFERLAELLAQG